MRHVPVPSTWAARPGPARPRQERSAGRLKDSHTAVKQVQRAGLELTQRGCGAWTRLFCRPEGGKRRCVQLS
ncbi:MULTISPECIES: hypothetical protein [unclassified Streptomyces]|uniref:hypothetical protein n=1 Tax=unclassified Streptomyces TaxID=2593676 RepID=UPI001BE7C99F|nr:MULTISPECIES: hypothetical protein [unclassified Streptomyces]MBT2407528.1 hypothetical protein [Streptomyces sp. ISL-21]MBT2608133.1 hypothetical protein [Streptomyces sp. ISL-87]